MNPSVVRSAASERGFSHLPSGPPASASRSAATASDAKPRRARCLANAVQVSGDSGFDMTAIASASSASDSLGAGDSVETDSVPTRTRARCASSPRERSPPSCVVSRHVARKSAARAKPGARARHRLAYAMASSVRFSRRDRTAAWNAASKFSGSTDRSSARRRSAARAGKRGVLFRVSCFSFSPDRGRPHRASLPSSSSPPRIEPRSRVSASVRSGRARGPPPRR